ncbi:Rha family transcriptional regulator [Lactococcus nasutitermitis]|uniref:Rha family transcriptional regulator n=1 Tax=Lactococcus nasutitermitis TaxID=1652957 RepID=A0ABV9JED7_9LACT|nr:phage regulatory protein/antirepressor Ant [Lactococcus nasutitermitis]
MSEKQELVFTENGQALASSKKVADSFDKQHKDVLEIIDNLVAEKSAAKFFAETTYKNRGKEYRMYVMTRDGFTLLAMGFNGKKALDFKIKYIEAFNKMEQTLTVGIQAPQTMKEALQLALVQQEQIESLQLESSVQKQQIAELQPKASYYDWVLQTKDLVSVTIIAKQYGKSAQWLNELLHELKIQFKQGKVWLLYQKYAESGYTKTNFAPDDAAHLHPHTKWTQKGMLFIYETLKKENILPLVEHEDVA